MNLMFVLAKTNFFQILHFNLEKFSCSSFFQIKYKYDYYGEKFTNFLEPFSQLYFQLMKNPECTTKENGTIVCTFG